MKTSMLAGQFALARPVGRLSDRYGNRPLLVAGQICVAASLGFFLLARSPQTAWWVLGAWLLWSAYVAHNICLPNLVLKLAPDATRAGYLAATDAVGSLFHAAATIAGGYVFDWLRDNTSLVAETGWPLEPFATMFAIGIAMRLLAVQLAASIREHAADA
jgi:MFS family permease